VNEHRATQDLLVELETALHRVVETFWDHPYHYFTEADAHVGLHKWLATRPALSQTLQTADGFETGLLHCEYPTFFCYDKNSPVERLDPPSSRGHYDLALLDPGYVLSREAQTIMNRRDTEAPDASSPPLLAAIEFKLYDRGWSPLRVRGVMRDVGKLRLTLQHPAHARAAYLCVLQRIVSQHSSRSDLHWKREVRVMLQENPEVRAVVAMCWPNQRRDPFVHYSGPWITTNTYRAPEPAGGSPERAKATREGGHAMRDEALFLNGVPEEVLEDILKVQLHLPEQILYLQPYSSERIVHLAEDPPRVDDPMRLFASLTDGLPTVRYVGEVVGWDSKLELSGGRLHLLNRIIYFLQPTEPGVYGMGKAEGRDCANLLHVWRLRKLSKPFSVVQLTNVNTGAPLSDQRKTAGGWVYVTNPDDAWLAEYL